MKTTTPPKWAPSALQLVYQPMDADMLSYTNKSAAPVAGSKNLARDGTSLFLHGNNRIGVFRGGRDSTDKHGKADESIYRVWRVWSAPLDPTGLSRTGEYSTGGGSEFTNDGSGGQSWVDVPGVTVSANASGRSHRRHLIEFLVSVQGNPDAGGIYFIIVLDETPSQYRVRLYKAREYTAEEWREFFPMGFSFERVETTTGPEERPTVSVHTWKPFSTEDAEEVGLDSGWQKFP